MIRLRFLEHIIGTPSPGPSVFLKGELAWVEDDMASRLGRLHGYGVSPFCVEAAADAASLTCRQCRREFTPDTIAAHMKFFHRLGRLDARPVPKKEQGEFVCFSCRPIRRFRSPHGLAVHCGHMHKDESDVDVRPSGTDPP